MTPSEQQASDLHRAYSDDGPRRTHIGGQALLGGVMMRGTYNWALAVRTPQNDIHVEEHDLASGREKNKWMYWPLIRGCRALVESLALGYKALEISTKYAFFEDDKEGSEEAESAFGTREMVVSMVLGILLAVVLFVVAPAVLTNLIVGEYDSRTFLWNVVDGLVRVLVFVFYIWLIGHMKDLQEMFAYHGAEHKTIHCYEHRLELTPANARSFPRLHVRCGTAFLIMVMLIAIFVYSITPINALIAALGVPDGAWKLALVICVRILLLPLIAGISYELTVKWAGNHPDNPVVKVILWPGMQMQYLTTREPDDSQLECAIVAMQRVLKREEAEKARLEELSECSDNDATEKNSPSVVLS